MAMPCCWSQFGSALAVLVSLALSAVAVARASSQLSSSTPDAGSVGNGACEFPSAWELALDTNIFQLYSPFRSYFIPRASKAFYRTQYEILHAGCSGAAASEEEIASLRPRAQFLTRNALRNAGVLEISFQGDQVWFAYRCLPSSLNALVLASNPVAAMLNVTCTVVGRSTSSSVEENSKIYYSVIWSDETAVNVWGCFEGEKNFHILSKKPNLTPEQLRANEKVLVRLGFDPGQAMDMKY